MNDQHWIATPGRGLDGFEFVDVDVAPPQAGEVTIEVRAAGVNPADAKHVAASGASDPIAVGYELAGVISALGPDTAIGSGGGAVGDEVIAFRVQGGYATSITVAASTAFAKPTTLDWPEAANLLLVGTTAAEMLHVVGVGAGDTVVLHGASGAVGLSVLQQAALLGVRVVGTASASSFDTVRRFGGTPVAYGDGLEQRVRDAAPSGVTAALIAVGTDEALDVSLALVGEANRVVSIVATDAARQAGVTLIGGAIPASAAFRDSARAGLVALAANGRLVVPMARTYRLAEARDALEFLSRGHPGGKLALIP